MSSCKALNYRPFFHGRYQRMGRARIDTEAFMNYYNYQRSPQGPMARGSTKWLPSRKTQIRPRVSCGRKPGWQRLWFLLTSAGNERAMEAVQERPEDP